MDLKDWSEIHERYMQDKPPVRLGGLAANLARVSSFAKNPANQKAVEGLLEESEYSIEWTAPEVEINTAAELVELQIQLARWLYTLDKIWQDTEKRNNITQQARVWSDYVLDLSGLLIK